MGEPLADALFRFVSESIGDWFSFVGEVLACMEAMPSKSASESTEASRECGCGDSSRRASEERCKLRRLERGEGVFAGEDFWGEIDLARSVRAKGQRDLAASWQGVHDRSGEAAGDDGISFRDSRTCLHRRR
jgi:hypothetical protein